VRCAQGIWRCRWSQGTDTLNDVGSTLKKTFKINTFGKRILGGRVSKDFWDDPKRKEVNEDKAHN